MKKGITVSVLILFLIFSLTACALSDSPAEEKNFTEPTEQNFQEEFALDPTVITDELISYRSVDEILEIPALSLDPYFILHEDCFYPLETYKMEISDYTGDDADVFVDAFPGSVDSLITVHLAQGDKVVTFSDAEDRVLLVPVDWIGYCLPVLWTYGNVDELTAMTDHHMYAKGVHTGVDELAGREIKRTPLWGSRWSDVQEVDSIFLSVLEDAGFSYYSIPYIDHDIESYRYVIMGEYGTPITLGQYKETSFVEEEHAIDASLYNFRIQDATISNVNRTKNGYFEIEINAADGIYSIVEENDSGESVSCYTFVLSNN